MMRVGGVVIAGLLGLVAGLWTWTRPGAEIASGEGPPVVVHILNNGLHTDLAVPRAALEARGGPLTEASRSVGAGDWILIGWGDARFFTDTSPMEGRLLDGARAFFRPGNPSVVMLDPHAGDPTRGLETSKVRTLRLSPSAFAGMIDRVERSLDLENGLPRLSTARPGADAHFFASHEHFWIGYLCNSWTARVLNAAGLDIRPMRAVTAGEVVATLDRAKVDTASQGA